MFKGKERYEELSKELDQLKEEVYFLKEMILAHQEIIKELEEKNKKPTYFG